MVEVQDLQKPYKELAAMERQERVQDLLHTNDVVLVKPDKELDDLMAG